MLLRCIFLSSELLYRDSRFLVAQMVKNLSAIQKTQVRSLGQEGPLEKGMATRSSILAWRILWTGEPGMLQLMGLQRVGCPHLPSLQMIFGAIFATFITVSSPSTVCSIVNATYFKILFPLAVSHF